jgi:hypothetical protein
MRTNRSSLFAYVAIAALGVAATSLTASEASAGIFCGRGFGGGFSTPRYFSPAPVHRERVVVRRPVQAPTKVAAATQPAKAPPNKTIAAAQPVKVVAPSKPVESKPTPAAEPTKVASTAGSAEVTQAAGTAQTNAARIATPCLTKQYLATGAVLFKDGCTNEWAINSTSAKTQSAASSGNCLTKENHPNGVLMFRDTCTNEWAMNTAERLAELPPTR